MDIGVFLPIGNNGWLISKSSPQYMPSFELNKAIVQRAEEHGLDFALTMIKLKGFGGETEFWDHCLESFTLTAGLAAVTERIKLYASAPVLALPPAIAARMAVTIDSIAPGRAGVNIVTGWAPPEYAQMGLWPGDEHFANRYTRAAEYVTVLRQLWSEGVSNVKGEFYRMDECVLSPRPAGGHIDILAAGQSGTGMRFAAEYADGNFILGSGVNTPLALSEAAAALAGQARRTGREVGTLALFMVIAEESDGAAQAKWKDYHDNADLSALGYMTAQTAKDKDADESSTAKTVALPEGAVNLNMGTLVGSYGTVARMLDQVSEVHGVKGVILVFDEFLEGVEKFGTRIQPLMTSRASVSGAP
ncbi:pyrimidine utilization protein A [Streptomyces clavuligerus]|nr:pyrimidine utilization protein A [Streptomyces clavuligerus]ANW17001.1 pyrimidine utilization protein A [Streptomyces clavuligerus]AXU11531.1 pyrimidine utilization protein A [Streptomyces clavuligerus]EDY51345.1 monooxygenase [Streptomyces clavuligerus]MBY6301351.1 pyrimidine utilization protein A [Streptomyces clavuligerus]QCS04403.1 pyrimidine utilization protein A [Streptomyces clavuligerus]